MDVDVHANVDVLSFENYRYDEKMEEGGFDVAVVPSYVFYEDDPSNYYYFLMDDDPVLLNRAVFFFAIEIVKKKIWRQHCLDHD